MVTLLDQQICWRTNVLDLEPSLYNRTHTQVHLFPACKAFFYFFFYFFTPQKKTHTTVPLDLYKNKQFGQTISKSLTTMHPIAFPLSFQWLMSSSRIESPYYMVLPCMPWLESSCLWFPSHFLSYCFHFCQHSSGVSKFSCCLYCSLYLD